ncbi:MAG: hypothetical protein V1882_03925 [Candidatus Omnitrophota bacterium]
MNKKILFLIFVSVLAGLNVGSIRRSEDPVRDTQTNPILYEQKKEEEKDGKKGPLMYHVKNVPREGFLIDPPIEKEKTDSSAKTVAVEAASPAGTSSWWEEEPKDPQTDSHAEAVSEPLPEIPPETEKVLNEEVVEEPAAESKTEDAASTKKEEDTWW